MEATTIQTTKRVNVGAWSMQHAYRQMLRLSHAAARTIDRHPTISNALLWLMVFACLWAVLTYNFTTHL